MPTQHADIFTALDAPFEDWEVRTRKGDAKGARELAYVDASTVANRLDEVLGPESWSDDTVLYGDIAVCRLTIVLPDGRSITRSGIGSYIHTSTETKLQDPANLAAYRAKAAASDAFKRAAAKLGVGRYLGKSGVPPFARGAFPDCRQADAPPPRQERERSEPLPLRATDDDPTLPPRRPPVKPDATQGAELRPVAPDQPRTGRALFQWLKLQGGNKLLDRVAGWGKTLDYPSRMVDWSPDQADAGFAEARRLMTPAAEPARSDWRRAKASALG
jgi:hypothetical protein